jgi:galactosylceramidase
VYAGFNWYRASIMTALQPYSGAYTISPQIWATAHTTQFSAPGWNYLLIGTGVGTGAGLLTGGGSYITLQSADKSDFTIVIEKMSRDHSTCVRPGLPDYTTVPETATFTLGGTMAGVKTLNGWFSHFAFTVGDTQVEFQALPTINVVNGQFTVNITVDSMYTFTTISTGSKGSYPAPPTPTLFPTAYTDNYEACPISSEANYWTDMK